MRSLNTIEEPGVTKEQAIEIARAECSMRGWRFCDPYVVSRRREWVVSVNRESLSSPWIAVSKQTGEITRSGIPVR